MDSGSGSLQSSSGEDDQEYDSRAESISSFLNPSTHFASISNPNPIHPPPPSSFFDLSSHHHPLDSSPFSVSHSPPNPLYNLDPVWSRNLRSDPNYTDFVNQSLLGSQPAGLNQGPVSQSNAAARVVPHHHQGVAAKNPKKRTRASRRAPTTVLTTDTSNFRQMVQEFTGIPAAPFSAASSPFSRRLDLFGGSALGNGPLYPLRPSPQKLQFLNSDASATTSTNNVTTTAPTVAVGTPSNNYQEQTSDHGFPKQPQTLLNLQNPLFTFQSLLQQQQPLPTTKSDHQLNSSLGGFTSSSSSTRWKDHHGAEDENLGAFDGNNDNSQHVRGYKLNSSNFQIGKGLENAGTSRGIDQGNVDSWICPSD